VSKERPPTKRAGRSVPPVRGNKGAEEGQVRSGKTFFEMLDFTGSLTLEDFRRGLRESAESRVCDYARVKKWEPLRPVHLKEILRKVPDALWSMTVRDLIAEAVT
jgi:hypothetical protein